MGKMTKKQFLNLVTLQTKGNISVETVENVLDGFYQAILDNFCVGNDEVHLEGFGTFKHWMTKGGDKKIWDFETGDTKLLYCPPKHKMTFVPSKKFLDYMENDTWEFERRRYKPKSTRKHKAEKREEKNAKRRKEKPTSEMILVDAINRANKRKG